VPKDFPTTLPPPPDVPREELRANFGMNATLEHMLGGRAAIPALQELTSLRSWCSTLVQLDRPSHIKAHAHDTLQKLDSEVRLYLGFLANYQQLDSGDITLWQCCNPTHLAAYMSLLKARQLAPNSIISYISNLKKVLYWLATLQSTAEEQVQLQQATQWLTTCSSQAYGIGTGTNHNMEAQSRLPTCREVLLFQDIVVAKAELMFSAAMASHNQLNVLVAKCTMEAFLFCMMFGYHPPIRASCLLSMIHPDFVSTTPCTHHGCNASVCKGNRMEWVSGTNMQQVQVICPHHKNSSRGRDIAIQFTLSTELAPLALRYLKECHPYLSHGRPQLFFSPSSGSPLTPSNFSHWFKGLQSRHTVQFIPFAPRQLRHIFVTERMGDDAVPGPEARACARVMGNSIKRWLQTYDTQVSVREVATCVKDMATWRQALLATE
jgi:hypothetical protein